MPASEDLIKAVLGDLKYVDWTKRYHTPLPPELEDHYVYTKDQGHSVLARVHGLPFPNDPAKSCKVVPVKSALRHYWTEDDWLVVPQDYVVCPNGPVAFPADPSDLEF